ncbi:MAG: DUF4232 domain-containing protein [Streptosporangiaceae bacterium]
MTAGCASQVSGPSAGPGAANSAPLASARRVLAASPAGHRVAAGSPDRTECGAAAVRVSFVNNGAAAGTSYDDLNFANVSGRSCYLAGWPGVSYVTRPHGQPVGAPASWARGRYGRVVLAPDGAAHAALTFAYNPLIGASAECPAHIRVRWLRVYPPGHHAPAFLSLGFTAAACTNGFKTLFVGPLQPGAATSELP